MHTLARTHGAQADDDAGFTLLEVLIAVGLVAASVISIAQLFVLTVRADAGSRDLTFGALLASEKMEQLRSADYSGVPTQGQDAVDVNGLPLDAGAAAPAFRRRWTVAPLPLHPPQAVVVTVIVSSASEPSRAVRMTTIRARRQ